MSSFTVEQLTQLREIIQPLQTQLTTLKQSVDQILTKFKIINKDVKLTPKDYGDHIKYNSTLQKVLFIMRYVISTKDGVFVTFPCICDNGEHVFVTNVHLLRFVAKHMFPKDISQDEIGNVIHMLADCQVETYVFDNEEMESIRSFFPIEIPKKKLNEDKQSQWFGIRPEILKELFGAVNSNYLSKSKYTLQLKEWRRRSKQDGKSYTEFPTWTITKRSRSQVYPSKSINLVNGKVQWGCSMHVEFFQRDVYAAISKLDYQDKGLFQKITQTNQKFHVGPGWIILTSEPVTDRRYSKLKVAPDKMEPKPKTPRRKQSATSTPKRRKTSAEFKPATSADPFPIDQTAVASALNSVLETAIDVDQPIQPVDKTLDQPIDKTLDQSNENKGTDSEMVESKQTAAEIVESIHVTADDTTDSTNPTDPNESNEPEIPKHTPDDYEQLSPGSIEYLYGN